MIPTTFLQGIVMAPWQMIGARLLQGISSAMIFAPALALAGDLAKEGQSGSQLSVLTVSFGLGVAFGQFISGFLVQFGYIVPFATGAVLAGIGLLLVYTQVEDTSIPKKPKSPPLDHDKYTRRELDMIRQNYQC